MPALTTTMITDVEALPPLVPAWWELWRRCPQATPFQSPAWLVSWWQAFAPGTLQSCCALSDGELVAFFPFYLEREVGGARLLPLGISLSDYLDVLAYPACAEAADALIGLMIETPWESWSFEEMAADACALDLTCPVGCSEILADQGACPVLKLQGATDLEGCVPARRRRQLRRALRTASSSGEVRVSRCEHDSDRFLDILFSLHGARWHEREAKGILADPRVQRFHRAALPQLAAAGLARCYLLSIDDRYAAAYYGFLHRGSAFAYLGGFDPNFAEASPGAMLIGRAIADAISEGAREFHFLRGREDYKYGFGAQDRWNRRRVWTKAPPNA
jgi:CelD/BcsL family acetyltransferase involved in cellulose biosynthesis